MTCYPQLRSGDVVVMDNLPAHKSAAIGKAIEAVGARLIYLHRRTAQTSTQLKICGAR